MPAPLIVLINGLPGAGKSTVARELAAALPRAAVVEGDHLQHGMTVSGLVAPGEEPAQEAWDQLDLRWRNLAALARNFHDAGFTAVVDSLAIPRLLAPFRTAVAPRPMAYLHLDPRREVSLARDAARGHKRIGDRHDWVSAEFDRMRGIGAWIDSSEQTVAETVQAGLDALADGTASQWRRRTGRVLPVDARGRVLLLEGTVPGRDGFVFWHAVGGSVEPGETTRAAAARELAEECGIHVPEGDLGAAFASEPVEFGYAGFHTVQEQDFYVLPLPEAPEPDLGAMAPAERATMLGASWVPVEEIGRAVYVDNPRLVPLCEQAVRLASDTGAVVPPGPDRTHLREHHRD